MAGIPFAPQFGGFTMAGQNQGGMVAGAPPRPQQTVTLDDVARSSAEADKLKQQQAHLQQMMQMASEAKNGGPLGALAQALTMGFIGRKQSKARDASASALESAMKSQAGYDKYERELEDVKKREREMEDFYRTLHESRKDKAEERAFQRETRAKTPFEQYQENPEGYTAFSQATRAPKSPIQATVSGRNVLLDPETGGTVRDLGEAPKTASQLTDERKQDEKRVALTQRLDALDTLVDYVNRPNFASTVGKFDASGPSRWLGEAFNTEDSVLARDIETFLEAESLRVGGEALKGSQTEREWEKVLRSLPSLKDHPEVWQAFLGRAITTMARTNPELSEELEGLRSRLPGAKEAKQFSDDFRSRLSPEALAILEAAEKAQTP